MKTISIAFFLAGATAMAAAAPIAGKICVGTWGTQAEFADVRVVKGSTRLYSSSFFSGTAGWTFTGGTWSTANGYLRQTGSGFPALATVGDASWTDYTLTLKARKISGDEGFLIGFGMPTNNAQSWWNLGGWGNTQHAIQSPGFSMLAKSGSVQANRWYTIKIEVKGSDVRCYLDNVKMYDTMRLLDDDEWTDRKEQVLNAGGLTLLPGFEQDQVRELLGRGVYRGAAARAKFDSMPGKQTFNALTSAQQAPLVRNVNRNRLTWNWSYINDPNDTYKLGVIQDAMDGACMLYNSLGVFDKHINVESVPSGWVPTADASYNGTLRFGGSWNRRVAIHELSHTLGTGTIWQWGNLMVNGNWNGTYANLQVQAFDGAGAIMHGDGMHYWPYGQNYDNEWSPTSEQRTVKIVEAFRRDMGISGVRDTVYSTEVANGTYRISPRLAPNSALQVQASNPNNSAPIEITGYTGALNQQFLLDKQADGSYRIRTALAGNRAVDIPGGVADGGAQVQLWDDNGSAAQRWFLIPTGDGHFKIAPANNVWRSMDLWGGSSADGTPVKLWDFFDGFNQQFTLTKLN